MEVDMYLKHVRWLESKMATHPHRCRTQGVKYPKPEAVDKKLPGVPFIRAPLGKESEWGFVSQADMTTFKSHYITTDNQEGGSNDPD